MKKHNFSSGPAILPAEVMEKAAQAVIELDDTGLSVLEISHRSKEFIEILEETTALVHELLGLDDNFCVLFLGGGASSQFYMTAMNLLDTDQTACFVDTGVWSAKAIREAMLFGKVEVVASSKAAGYTFIPKNFTLPEGAKYLHITTNNTIHGSQFHQIPQVEIPIVADMSSDIFSKPIDSSRFGLIYAGMQKNMGPAGGTLVIVKKDWLEPLTRPVPTMLRYQTHIENSSLFNTPPVFPIYVSLLTLRWLKAQGGVAAMQRQSQEKAKLLYDEIDANPCFYAKVAVEDRSLMNVTFYPTDSRWESPFLECCKEANLSGIKGHRSAGGFRASIYNALPSESVRILVEVMKDFAQKNA